VREARINETREGRLPAGDGWFILNLGEMPWETVPGFGVWRDLDWARVSGAEPVVGIHIHVLQPGETNGYYHAEAAQEGFVVLSGECLALVEGQERPMRQWDFLHSPPGTAHITIGAGDGPCVILMFGGPIPAGRSSGSPTRPPPGTEQASSRRPETPARRTATCRTRCPRLPRRRSGGRVG
jgi:mannose-6-phosphate isomerase-like protein (cupin superfamily)